MTTGAPDYQKVAAPKFDIIMGEAAKTLEADTAWATAESSRGRSFLTIIIKVTSGSMSFYIKVYPNDTNTYTIMQTATLSSGNTYVYTLRMCCFGIYLYFATPAGSACTFDYWVVG